MNRISELRKRDNLTIRELSSKVNINYASLSRMENNKQNIDIDTLKRLTDYFKVTSDYILGLNNEISDKPKESVPSHSDNNIRFALYGDVKELTDEELADVRDYISFVKTKRTSDNK